MKKKRYLLFLGVSLLCFAFTARGYDINYAQALQTSIFFYDANMCGPHVEENSRLEWRGNCHMWDAQYPHPFDPAKTIDLSGGFHDCGDHVKFGQPQVYAISTLGWGYYEFKEAFIQSGQQQHMLDVLKWGTDYLLRCTELNENDECNFFFYMVGKGGSDHVVWIPPELQTMAMDARPAVYASPSDPAAEMAAGASAALTLMYLNYQEIDRTYAEKCLKYAKALYNMGKKYGGLGTGDGFYNSRDAEDDLSWAATWLYVATGEMDYIHHIDSCDEEGIYTGYISKIITTTSNTWQNIWVHCWDSTWGGAFTKLATLFPEREDFNYYARWNLEFLSGGAAPHADGSTHYLEPTAAGYMMLNTWGSARYNTAAQLCSLVYNKYYPEKGEALARWARGQMEYILGDNPMGYSYMVGYPSPEKSAGHPHHRAAHGSQTNSMLDPVNHRHILWGALVGGPDGEDYHEDVTSDYVYNEVRVDYNAAIVGALAGHYLLWKDQQGEPLVDFPPAERATNEYYCEAKLELDSKDRSQYTLRVYNESVHPPHYQANISVRYYFDISEMMNHGQDIDDVTFSVIYDELSVGGSAATTARGPLACDAAKGIYYMEIIWEYPQWYGDLEYHFALVPAQDSTRQTHWDSTNDWSHQGIKEAYTTIDHIPVYVEGVQVFGTGPDGTTPQSPTPVPGETPAPTPATGFSGDVNTSGAIDIVDALMIAQFYVGSHPQGFIKNYGDVNKDKMVNILDALMVAQYYVDAGSAVFCGS